MHLLSPPTSLAAQIVEQVKEATASPDSVNKTIAIKVLTPNVALRKMFGRFILGENRQILSRER